LLIVPAAGGITLFDMLAHQSSLYDVLVFFVLLVILVGIDVHPAEVVRAFFALNILDDVLACHHFSCPFFAKVDIVSPEGKILKSIPIIETYCANKYARPVEP
jgi:hypothetical protein